MDQKAPYYTQIKMMNWEIKGLLFDLIFSFWIPGLFSWHSPWNASVHCGSSLVDVL